MRQRASGTCVDRLAWIRIRDRGRFAVMVCTLVVVVLLQAGFWVAMLLQPPSADIAAVLRPAVAAITAAMIGATALAAIMRRRSQREIRKMVAHSSGRLCPSCGYVLGNLALPSPCPECGHTLPLTLPQQWDDYLNSHSRAGRPKELDSIFTAD